MEFTSLRSFAFEQLDYTMQPNIADIETVFDTSIEYAKVFEKFINGTFNIVDFESTSNAIVHKILAVTNEHKLTIKLEANVLTGTSKFSVVNESLHESVCEIEYANFNELKSKITKVYGK